MEKRIGVYICHCGTNIAGTVDVEKVAQYAKSLDSVVVARDYMFMCSEPGQELIRNDIKELGLNRVVVAACSPRLHQSTFRRVVEQAGLNPYLLGIANIREHCSWVHPDEWPTTEKAEALIRAAVRRVSYHEPLEAKEVTVNPNVLVVGGGIAGIQTALKIADSEHKVYLVEREPSIGGHAIQLDKTFPTLDCSACILTPKMTMTGSHPYIELMSYSEVVGVSGFVGNFKVKVRKKPRYVNLKECTACNECTKVCPVEVPSEFNLGLSKRKAIYRSFPQAVPGAFVIDKRGYSPCRIACPAGVNAQGYVALISQGKFKEALESLRQTMPFAGVCGRVCTHPCELKCERGKVDEPIAIRALKRFMADYELRVGREKATPVKQTREDKVAIVGSGPAGLACAYDLVRKGYPVTVFEAAPKLGGLLRYGIPDYRLPKTIVDNEISYIQELGVEIRANTVVKNISEISSQGYKAIFLACGAGVSQRMGIPGEDTPGVIHALDFLRQVNAGTKVVLGNRVAVIGGGNAAIDAASVAWRLGTREVTVVYRRSRAEMPAIPSEVAEMEKEGIKIELLASPVRVVAKDGKISGIECIRMELGDPDESGRRRPVPIKGSEFTINVDNVIIAIGQTVNKEMLPQELSFTRLGTVAVDPVTLQTNIAGVFAGGDVVAGPAGVVTGHADVVTAIATGKEAAISIDRYLRGIDLKEGRPEVKEEVKEVAKAGIIRKARAIMPLVKVSERARSFAEIELGFDEKTAVAEANRCLNCAVCSECLECVKVCERKAINHEMKEEIVELEVGNIIVATGYNLFDPTPLEQYGYGRLDNVITALQFERMCSPSGPTGGKLLLKDGREPQSVAIIHCVGSRDKNYHEYCSRVCCMYALKYSHLIKEKTNAEVYQMYIDMRCVGKGFEEFYARLSEEGVKFIRGKVAKVTDRALTEEEKGRLAVSVEDTLLGDMVRVPVDMVILCIALEPQIDVEKMARLFNISRSRDGFFLERHPKLDPVATMSDGIFVVGCCQGPKDIPDTVAQASAGAAEALAMISKGKVTIEPITCSIDEEICAGCGLCENMCPYSALSLYEPEGVMRVNEALCKGCGACAATCPSGAAHMNHFTYRQLLDEIEALTY